MTPVSEVDPIDILKQVADSNADAFELMVTHGQQVAQKALASAETVSHLNPDRRFIQEAAMLHDIGVFLTRSQQFRGTGDYPYVCHGFLGREVLEKIGLPRHALVCERHVGVGISKDDIRQQTLPLPLRDMRPVTIEEKLICYADKFFSKSASAREKTVPEILAGLARYGQEKTDIFLSWRRNFDGPKTADGRLS